MRQRPLAQKTLFEDTQASQFPQLRQELRAKLMQLMVQWMQPVAKARNQEMDDEQDHG